MLLIEFLRWSHVIGACVLLGTGAGIAFFMLMADRTGNAAFIAHTSHIVVVADFVFTATAVVVQPITRCDARKTIGLAAQSRLACAFTGLCWLPVVWLQIRMRELARIAERSGDALPPAYHRLFRMWWVLGIPASTAVLTIMWLMINKPTIQWLV